MLSIRIRNELTEEWQKRGVERGKEFAILTDEITRTWSGMTTRQYKKLKGLKKQNLRDNMSDTELVLTMLAEASTRDISRETEPEAFRPAWMWPGRAARWRVLPARRWRQRTGKPVITEKNAAQLNAVVTEMIEPPPHSF